MSYGLSTFCELCGEPMSEVYFLENILGTMDSVVSCTDKKCDYWECQPDHNTMADYGLNQDGTALTEKEEDDEDERVFPEYKELLKEVKRLRDGIRLILSEKTAYDLEVFERKLVELIK